MNVALLVLRVVAVQWKNGVWNQDGGFGYPLVLASVAFAVLGSAGSVGGAGAASSWRARSRIGRSISLRTLCALPSATLILRRPRA